MARDCVREAIDDARESIRHFRWTCDLAELVALHKGTGQARPLRTRARRSQRRLHVALRALEFGARQHACGRMTEASVVRPARELAVAVRRAADSLYETCVAAPPTEVC
jgi:hypothetical protein